MSISPKQLEHALEPLKVVDVKALSGIADSLKKSADKRKKAVGVFLDRINRYRVAQPKESAPPSRQVNDTGLLDLHE